MLKRIITISILTIFLFNCESYQRPQKQRTPDISLIYQYARVYQQQEMYDEAIKKYKELIYHRPNHLGGHYGLGVVYAKIKRYNLSIKHFKVVRERDPYNKGLMFNMGFVYYKAQYYKRAYVYLRQACRAGHNTGCRYSGAIRKNFIELDYNSAYRKRINKIKKIGFSASPLLIINKTGTFIQRNNRRVSLPCSKEELAKVLGKPNRKTKSLSSYVWDKYGLSFIPWGKSYSFYLTLGNKLGFKFKSNPRSFYNGKIMLDDSFVQRRTNIVRYMKNVKNQYKYYDNNGNPRWIKKYKTNNGYMRILLSCDIDGDLNKVSITFF